MNLAALISDFKRLETGKKLVFFGALIALIAVFLPWYQIKLVESTDFRVQSIPVISNGFNKYPIFGFLSVAVGLASLVLFVRDFMGMRQTGGYTHGKIWALLGGEIMFVLFIALFVFLSEKQTIPSSDVRFGIFLSLFGSTLICLGGYLVEQATKQQETLDAFRPPLAGHFGSLNIRAEEPEINTNQLSFSEAHGRR